MTHRYVPILRWKQGERTALQNLSAAGRLNVCPLIILGPGQYKDAKVVAPLTKKKAGKSAPATPSEIFSKQVIDACNGTRVFVDASTLFGGPAHHQIDDVAAAMRAAGSGIIPATQLVANAQYQAAVKRVVAKDGAGVALRITLAQMTAAPKWHSSWEHSLAETDLIIDLAGSVANVAALGTPVATAFAGLYKANEWRSVTLAGGCIPATLTGFKVGCTNWTRDELKLWHDLQSHGLNYQLDFGDYTSISPDASTDAIPGPVPINGKYTLRNEFLIFHGVKIKGPGSIAQDKQLRSYAKHITGYSARGALPNCWGDMRFDEISNNSAVSASSPGGWVGFNVNRHIEITRRWLP